MRRRALTTFGAAGLLAAPMIAGFASPAAATDMLPVIARVVSVGVTQSATSVTGTPGNDTIDCSAASPGKTIFGLDGDDTVTGTSLTDTIYGAGGNDTITGAPSSAHGAELAGSALGLPVRRSAPILVRSAGPVRSLARRRPNERRPPEERDACPPTPPSRAT